MDKEVRKMCRRPNGKNDRSSGSRSLSQGELNKKSVDRKASPTTCRVPKARSNLSCSRTSSTNTDLTMRTSGSSSLGGSFSGRPPLPMGGSTARPVQELTTASISVLDYSSGEDDGSSFGSTVSRRIRMTQSEDDSIELALPQSLDSVLRDMSQHPEDAMVQEFGCSALGALKKEPLSTLDLAVALVVNALERHSSIIRVQIEGLRALRRLSSSLDACCDASNSTGELQGHGKDSTQDLRLNKHLCLSIAERGAIPTILEAMESFQSSRTIQREGIRVLRNALRVNVTVSESIFQCNGVKTIIRAMWNHKESNSVQEDGCIILWIVSFNEERAQNVVLKENGIGAMVQAMKVHPEIERIHYHACGALHTLTFNDQLRAHAIELNAITYLIKAIKEHVYSEWVTEKACSALLNLLINKKGERKLCVMNADEMKVIVRSMELHSESRLVQRSAIRLLEASVRSRNNLSGLRRCSNVRSVLASSAESYPEDCGRSAVRIISMLDNRSGI